MWLGAPQVFSAVILTGCGFFGLLSMSNVVPHPSVVRERV